jgi:hypothetical protein
MFPVVSVRATRRAIIAAGLIAAPLPVTADPYIYDFTWLGGAGDWFNASAWQSGATIPPGNGSTAHIDGHNPTASLVTLSKSLSIGTLDLDADDTLTLSPGVTLTVDNTNLNGTLLLNGAGTSGATVNFTRLASPAGTGAAVVFGTSGADAFYGSVPAGVTLRGGGGSASLYNMSGTLDADTRGTTFTATVSTLAGTLRARAGATVNVTKLSDGIRGGTLQVDAGGTVTLGLVNRQYDGETHVDGLLDPGVFQILGGRLSGTGTVAGDIELAATLAPGPRTGDLNGPGTLHVHYFHPKSFSPTPMRTVIEIFGTVDTQYDRVTTDWNFELGGTLDVERPDGFQPALGDTFTIAAVDNPSDPSAYLWTTFTKFTGQDAGNGLRFAPVADYATIKLVAALPGDANLDHRVDYADFLLLKQNFKTATVQYGQGNFDGDATVGPADFDLLLANLGRGADQPLSPAQLADIQSFAATVPEPGTLALILATAGLLVAIPHPRRRRR